MGFRSTMVSAYRRDVVWPAWFREKWSRFIPLHEGPTALLGSAQETKTGYAQELPRDIQRALAEQGWFDRLADRVFVYIWLHECDGITRVQVERDAIRVSDPHDWNVTGEGDDADQDGWHNYCYGCSDAPRQESVVVDGAVAQREIEAGA